MLPIVSSLRLASLLLAAVAAIFFSSVDAATVAGRQTPSCNRGCLLRIVTKYADAINLKDTSAIPVAPNVRITDNGNVTTLGAGLVWRVPGLLRIPFRHVIADPTTGSVIFRATVTNQTVPEGSPPSAFVNPPLDFWYYYGLRLKVDAHGNITEIEEFAQPTSLTGNLPNDQFLQLPDRIWDTILPVEERLTRAELLQITNEYWDTVGSTLPWRDAPFHPECNRLELGGFTTNALFNPLTCGTEFLSPGLKGGKVSNRRLYVVDEERGVVGGVAVLYGPNTTVGTTVMEEFKIQDGLLRQLEAFFVIGTQHWSGWGTGNGSSQGNE